MQQVYDNVGGIVGVYVDDRRTVCCIVCFIFFLLKINRIIFTL